MLKQHNIFGRMIKAYRQLFKEQEESYMDRISVRATDSRFGAKGDGIVNDRASIQAAIDYVFSAGGGTVLLDAGKVRGEQVVPDELDM